MSIDRWLGMPDHSAGRNHTPDNPRVTGQALSTAADLARLTAQFDAVDDPDAMLQLIASEPIT